MGKQQFRLHSYPDRELWLLQMGGMTNMEALRAATINGAHYLGMDKEIGSLETGKLGDLIVLDKNPLEDIHNSNTIIYTMVNGRLYDSETMNEIGNHPKAVSYTHLTLPTKRIV